MNFQSRVPSRSDTLIAKTYNIYHRENQWDIEAGK